MKMFRWLIPFFCVALLAGCGGGGGSSSSSTPSTPDASVSGTISDPYIYNAYFVEYGADGSLIQETESPSTLKGKFTFPSTLTPGSTIKMKSAAGVFHASPEGVLSPYEGPLLTRRVSADLVSSVEAGGDIIVTPLTTLADNLQSAAESEGETLSEEAAIAQIVSMVNEANGGDLVDAETLFEDPMAAFEEGGDGDVSLLQASMAVNIALETEDIDASLDDALDLIQTVIPGGTTPTEAQFVAADAIVAVVAASNTPEDAIGEFSSEEVDAIVAAAGVLEDDQTLDVSEDGLVEVVDYQSAFDTVFTLAFGSAQEDGQLSSILYAEDLDINAEMITLAKNLGQAKTILAQADEAGVEVTITANDLDQLNFFYAFSRVVLLANPLSDGTENGLQRLGDILDALGVDTSDEVRSVNMGLETCETVTYDDLTETECSSTIFAEDDETGEQYIPDTTPTGAELQQFLYERAATELETAVAALDDVSATFAVTYAFEGVDTEFDYSDALYVKGVANASLCMVSLQQGLNLDADIQAIAELNDDADEPTLADFMNEGAEGDTLADNVLKIKDADALAAVKTYGIAACNGLKEAIAAIEAETDGQTDDLIYFYDEDPVDQEEMIGEILADVDTALSLLNGSTDFTTSEGLAFAVDLTNFFSGNLDLHALLPTFTGDAPGMFPDPTLGGVLSTDIGLNDDAYGDGVPDVLQEDLVKVTELMLKGQSFVLSGQMGFSLFVTFNEDYSCTVDDGSSTQSGSWALSNDGLTASLELSSSVSGTFQFIEGWQEEDGLEIVGALTIPSMGVEGVEAYLVSATHLTAFTPEILSWKTISRYDETTDFQITLNSESGTYSGYFSDNDTWYNISGSWTVDETGKLILTLDESLNPDGNTMSFEITNGYMSIWNEFGNIELKRTDYDSSGTELRTFTADYSIWQ